MALRIKWIALSGDASDRAQKALITSLTSVFLRTAKAKCGVRACRGLDNDEGDIGSTNVPSPVGALLRVDSDEDGKGTFGYGALMMPTPERVDGCEVNASSARLGDRAMRVGTVG